jgi:septal ring factor EnvC (AmiA/AmiB activator)
MRGQALSLAEKLNDLVRVMTDIRSEGERLKTETARLNDMRTRLAGLMETKKQSLDERQAELGQVRTAAAEIMKSVDDLNELITKLDQAVKQNTPALQAHEEEAKAAEQTASAETPAEATPGAPGATPPAAPGTTDPSKGVPLAMITPMKPAVELAPAGASLVPGSPGRIKPAIAFHQAKAMLPLPAQGRRVLSFGEKTQYGKLSPGLVIETRPNAQVISPCDGWVVYAGEFRSYGQLLIINAGGGYHVLVAGLSQINVGPGEFILAAEPVGTMGGEPNSAQPAAQSSKPVLYIELRKDGQPIDSEPWWAEGHQKVQG